MSEKAKNQPERPSTYIYRGRTVTNNGEQKALIKYNAIESIIRGVELYTNSAFLQEVQPFFDPTRPKPQYTVVDYLEVLDRICDWCYPNLSRAEGREQVGRLALSGFRKTIFGRVALATIHLIGPDRLLIRVPGLLANVSGTGKYSITKLGLRRYCFSTREEAGTYEETLGVLKAGLGAAGAQNVKCEVKVIAADSWDFILTWDEKI